MPMLDDLLGSPSAQFALGLLANNVAPRLSGTRAARASAMQGGLASAAQAQKLGLLQQEADYKRMLAQSQLQSLGMPKIVTPGSVMVDQNGNPIFENPMGQRAMFDRHGRLLRVLPQPWMDYGQPGAFGGMPDGPQDGVATTSPLAPPESLSITPLPGPPQQGGAPAVQQPAQYGLGGVSVIPLPEPTDVTDTPGARAKYGEELAGAAGKELSAQAATAEAHRRGLNTISQAMSLLDQGVIAGGGATLKLKAGQALRGLGFMAAEDPVKNTEAYLASTAQLVADVLSTKAFGAGTAVSDADLLAVRGMVAGDIELTPEGLRMILDIRERAARDYIKGFNLKLQNVKQGKFLEPVELPEELPAGAAPQSSEWLPPGWQYKGE